ncbi:hypothetical protein BDN72DRAFT_810559, partial [Pluteus cervinus]
MSSLAVPHRKTAPGAETYREKATRKFKENPWVPAGKTGCLLTVGALVTAMVKMRRGESRSFNNWLRLRVAAQGLTIGALVLGGYTFSTKKEEGTLGSQNDFEVEKRREEKLAKERTEFEDRLKEAEAVHAFETGAAAAPAQNVPSTPPPSSQSTTAQSGSKWFGWWKSGGSK